MDNEIEPTMCWDGDVHSMTYEMCHVEHREGSSVGVESFEEDFLACSLQIAGY